MYRVQRWKKFEDTRKQLIKNHYKQKSTKRYLAEFNQLIDEFLESLKVSPCPLGSSFEGWPKPYSYPEGTRFYKMHWRHLPGLSSSAAFGRAMYVVSEPLKLIVPFWIYTHEEYGGNQSRPPNKELLTTLKAVCSYISDQQAKAEHTNEDEKEK